jgi:hypothetical protein
MKHRDPYDIAIDQMLTAADGDVRLALQTVLMQTIPTGSESARTFCRVFASQQSSAQAEGAE